jgi:DNA-binding transcriptional LysR family regulator
VFLPWNGGATVQDLNDLYYYAQVVDHGGFAAASRATGEPKSKLSRRIAALEARLGVRLLQRSTRRFTVTELGRVYHTHCKAVLVEAEAAEEAIDHRRSEPCGTVRVSCPVALLDLQVGAMLAEFLARHPRVTLQLEATNRRVDVVAEGIDVAVRVRTSNTSVDGSVMVISAATASSAPAGVQPPLSPVTGSAADRRPRVSRRPRRRSPAPPTARSGIAPNPLDEAPTRWSGRLRISAVPGCERHRDKPPPKFQRPSVGSL